QQLVPVEAQSFLGPVRPVHPVAVEQARARLRQVAVPDVVGPLAQLDAVRLAAADAVEQAQFDALGTFGEDREVDALAVPGRSARVRTAGPDGGGATRILHSRSPVRWRSRRSTRPRSGT